MSKMPKLFQSGPPGLVSKAEQLPTNSKDSRHNLSSSERGPKFESARREDGNGIRSPPASASCTLRSILDNCFGAKSQARCWSLHVLFFGYPLRTDEGAVTLVTWGMIVGSGCPHRSHCNLVW